MIALLSGSFGGAAKPAGSKADVTGLDGMEPAIMDDTLPYGPWTGAGVAIRGGAAGVPTRGGGAAIAVPSGGAGVAAGAGGTGVAVRAGGTGAAVRLTFGCGGKMTPLGRAAGSTGTSFCGGAAARRFAAGGSDVRIFVFARMVSCHQRSLHVTNDRHMSPTMVTLFTAPASFLFFFVPQPQNHKAVTS
jgi:hypothetical protein